MTGFVYKWTNNINGKWYIGSRKGTTDDGYRHSSRIVGAAEKKYGIENFTREILFEGDYDKDQIRSVVEAKFLIEDDAANNPMSYNQTNITGNNCINEATRQKMRVAKLGKKLSIEHRKAQGLGRIGKPFTAERCKNISIAKTGVKRSKAACESISKGKLGKKLSAAHRKSISKGKKGLPQQSVICPHCDKTGGISLMYRYHFTNCKTLTA